MVCTSSKPKGEPKTRNLEFHPERCSRLSPALLGWHEAGSRRETGERQSRTCSTQPASRGRCSGSRTKQEIGCTDPLSGTVGHKVGLLLQRDVQAQGVHFAHHVVLPGRALLHRDKGHCACFHSKKAPVEKSKNNWQHGRKNSPRRSRKRSKKWINAPVFPT